VDSAALLRVRQDVSAAQALGATGTPVILMNGTRYRGTIGDDELEALIQTALKLR
jgi:protein-disulfide isomerase